MLTAVCFSGLKAQNVLTVEANKPVADVPQTMWGIFFEDINFAADGGLYAELVKNRSFEFSKPVMGWKEVKAGSGSGRLLIENAQAQNPKNPRYAHLTVNAPAGGYGLSNEGFRGMGIRQNEQYNFSVWAKKGDGDLRMKIELQSAAGKIWAVQR